MITAIQVIWWVGLIGALALTFVILKEVFLVVRMLRDMLSLSQRILEASHGINHHVGEAGALAGLGALLHPLPETLRSLTLPLGSIADRLERSTGG